MKRAVLLLLSLLFLALPLAAADHPLFEKGFAADKVYQLTDLDSVNVFNGNLIVTLPVGPRYAAGGGQTWGLTLTYNSKVWDHRQLKYTPFYHETIPSRWSNAGLGWVLSMGRIVSVNNGGHTGEDDGSGLFYQSPDGGDHKFWGTLHMGEPGDDCAHGGCPPATDSTFYTRDGTYLRLRHTTNNYFVIDFPDGTEQEFQPLTNDASSNTEWQLVSIHDRTRTADNTSWTNEIKVTYPPLFQAPSQCSAPTSLWRIVDRFNHGMWVCFGDHGYADSYWNQQSVDKIVFDAPPDPDSGAARQGVWEFTYTQQSIFRGFGDTNPNNSASVLLPMLTSLKRPDGLSFAMTYQLTATDTDQSNYATGSLQDMTLPTGGRVHWAYMAYNVPSDACKLNSWTATSPGVQSRELFAATGESLGKTTYETLPIGSHTIITCDTEGPAPKFGTQPPEELQNTVTNAAGEKTVHHFSVWPSETAANPQHGFINQEYGLPLTRFTPEPDTKGLYPRFLSTEVFDKNGTRKRAMYVAYKGDETSCLTNDSICMDSNRRLLSSRTIFDDDPGKTIYTDSEHYDGLGHFRKTTTTQNFQGSDVSQIEETDFNRNVTDVAWVPVQGWQIDPSYHIPAATSPWLLNLFTTRKKTEGSQTLVSMSCFDTTTGVEKAVRTLKGTTPGDHDLLTIYDRDASTNEVTFEHYYGGDRKSIGNNSTDLCSVAPSSSAEEYRIEHVYASGVRVKSHFINVATGQPLPFESLHQDIDNASGVVTKVYDTAGVPAELKYDVMGRLVRVVPRDTKPTKVTYNPPSGSGSSYVAPTVDVSVDSDTAGSAKKRYEYDSLGRLIMEKFYRADGTWAGRRTELDLTGRKSAVTELVPLASRDTAVPLPSTSTVPATKYFDYDAFGRPGRVRNAAGKEVTFSYTGTRLVGRTVSIATSATAESAATTTEEYDGFGRLMAVTEPGGPTSAAQPIGSNVTTSYGYDAGGRLTSVSMAGAPQPQQRFFNYDGRGLLASEQHPELGAGGNGTITYPEYDARGHLRKKVVGARDGRLDSYFAYDAAERLTDVFELPASDATTPTKVFVHSDFGTENAGADLRLGKLWKAVRHNYLTGPGDVAVTQTYTYGGRDGRISTLTTKVSAAAGDIQTFTQGFEYDDVADLTKITYPSIGATLAPAPSIGDLTQFFHNGFLTGVQGYADRLDPSGNQIGLTYSPNGLPHDIAHTSRNGQTLQVDTITPDDSGMPRPKQIDFTGYCAGPPINTAEPTDKTVLTGNPSTLSVTPPQNVASPTYTWYQIANGVATKLEGKTTAQITTAAITETSYFYVIVGDATCATQSRTAKVTPRNCNTIDIATQPQSKQVAQNTGATFTVAATESGAHYEWYEGKSGDTSKKVGTDSASLTVTAASETSYWVRVFSSDRVCSIDSSTAFLTLCLNVSIWKQPADGAWPFTDQMALPAHVEVAGNAPFTYTWHAIVNGTDTVVQTSSGVSASNDLTNFKVSAAGTYRVWVVVTDGCGTSARSNDITLTAYPPSCSDFSILGLSTELVQLPRGGMGWPIEVTTQPADDGAQGYSYDWVNSHGVTFAHSRQTAATAYTWETVYVKVTKNCVVGGVTVATSTKTSDKAYLFVYGSCPIAPVTVSPRKATIARGGSAVFQAVTDWPKMIHYQWYVGMSGDTSTPIDSVPGHHDQLAVDYHPKAYWVRVTNDCGLTADSPTATLEIVDDTYSCYPVLIAQSPHDSETGSGQTVTLSVDATSTPDPHSFTWFQGTGITHPLGGTANGQFNVTPAETTSYWVRVGNGCASADSDLAVVHVTSCGNTHITTQPADSPTDNSHPVTLNVAVSNPADVVSYAWYEGNSGDTTVATGGTGTTFTTPVLSATKKYWVRMSTAGGCKFDSRTALVDVCVPPAITSPTTSYNVLRGVSTWIAVSATGTDLQYQWYLGQSGDTSQLLTNATQPAFYATVVQTTAFWCKVSNRCHTENSPTIWVSVCPTFNSDPVAANELVMPGTTTTLSVDAGGATTLQWYQGDAGDTTHPFGGNTSTVTTPAITADTKFWVRATSGGCDTMSAAVLVQLCTQPSAAWSTHPHPIHLGDGFTLTVSSVPPAEVVTFYQGNVGDTSHPVDGPNAWATVYPTQTTTYWARAKIGNCWSDTTAMTIEVCVPSITQQPANVTLMPGQPSVTLSVTATLGASYQWYIGEKGDVHAPVTNGTTASINVTPASDTSYWVRVTGSCGVTADSNAALVTVCKPPVITTQPADDYLQRNYYTALMVVATGNDLTYQWYVGVKGDTTHPIQTAAGRSARIDNILAQNTTSYWVRVSGLCGSVDSNTATIHVCVPPSITTQPQNVTIFAGATTTLQITASESTGEPLHYQWYRGTTGDFSNPVGTDAATYTTPALSSETSYWVHLTSNSCTSDSDAATVSLCMYQQNVPAPSDVQIAIGQVPRLTGLPASSGNSYLWYRGASGDTSNPISGWQVANYVDVAPTVTTQYWYQLQNGPCTSNSGTVTVNVCVPTITTQPASTMINSGASTTLTVAANTPGLTYQWYIGAAGTTTSPISGATGASVTVSPAVNTTYWVRVIGSCGRTADSSAATVTICQPASITAVTPSQWLARGSSMQLGVAAAGSNITYQWYTGTAGNTASPINGATASTTSVAPLNTTSYWVRVTSSCGFVDSATITVSVCATPAITAQPQSVSTFSGTSATLSVTATESTTSPISYQWYRGVSGDVSTPVGTNSATYTTPALTSDMNYWVRVSCGACNPADSDTATVSMCAYLQSIPAPADQQTTVGQSVRLTGIPASSGNTYIWYRGASGDMSTPLTGWQVANYIDVAPTVTTQYWYRLQNGSCISSSATGTVYVCVPTITTQPANTMINPGASATLSVVANTSGLTYQWYVGTAGTTTSPIAGATGASVTVTPSVNTNYWVRVTGSCGRTTNSATATVTICQTPSIAAVTPSQWLARGSSMQLGVSATGTSLTYQWYTGTSGNTASPISGATASTVSVAPQNTTSYWVRVSGTCGTANSATITISVCATPSITTQPQSVSIFSGSSTTLSVAASQATTSPMSYQWYRGVSGDVSAPVGTNATSYTTPALTVDTNYWVRVSCGTCNPADSQTATVAMCIYSQVVTSSPDVQTTVGQSTRLTTVTNAGNANTYNWYRGAAGDTSAPQALGTPNNFLDVAPTVTTQYWAQVTNGSCVSRTNTITVSVCIPQMTTQPQSATIAAGTSKTLTAAANTAGVTYQWYIGASGTTTSPVAGGTSASLTVTPSATTTYWVRATSTCGRTVDSTAATVTICSPPVITRQPNDASPVYPFYTTYTDVLATGSNLTYQWYLGESGVTTSPFNGKTASSLTMAIQNTTRVWVRITGQCGSVDSRAVWLSVYPGINSQPESQAVSYNSTATVSVQAGGQSLHYRWMYNNGTVVATCGDASTCTTPPVTAPISLYCQVTSGIASVTSWSADITLCTGPSVWTSSGNNGNGCKYVMANINGDWTNVEWYQGQQGDTSHLITSGMSWTTVCPTTATTYWARVYGPDPGTGTPCSTDGPAVTVYP